MGNEWIVRCKGLSRKREVLQMSTRLRLHRRLITDTIMEFWEWADDETADGNLPGVTLEQLPGFIPETDAAFWQALVDVGWLVVTSDGLTIPNFDRWLGRSAKKRLQKSRRQKNWRDGSVDASASTKASLQDRTGHIGEAIASPAAKRKRPPKSPPKPRTRDPLFDAVAEVTASDPTVSGSHIGRICKLLREADPPYTPDEVRALPSAIPADWDCARTPTLGMVEKYIGRVRETPAVSDPGEERRRRTREMFAAEDARNQLLDAQRNGDA